METRHLRVALITLSLGMAPCAQDPQIQVRGRVLDAKGQPASGADLATFWLYETGTPKPSGRTPITTDTAGAFAGGLDMYQDKALMLAYSKDRMQAGSVEIEKKTKNYALEITLGPTVRVHGTLTCSQLMGQAAWTCVYLTLLPGKHRIAQCMSQKAEFDLRLPPGEYELHAYGTDLHGLRKKIVLAAGTPDLDLGALDVPAEYFALQRGKELPEWMVTAARGVQLEKSKLSDFRGKWLLIEFWGYW